MSDGSDSSSQPAPADSSATLRAYADATREIMRVVSESRHDERPVFETILENACHLGETETALLVLANNERTEMISVAGRGNRQDYLDRMMSTPIPLDTSISDLTGKAILDCQVVHFEDLSLSELYKRREPNRVAAVEEDGARTALAVPLISAGQAIGTFVLYRRNVRPFAPDQIALLEIFAAQAVIAIENSRQFRQLQTRLKREAATREILLAISQHQEDEQPVFDVVLRNAAQLCGSPNAVLCLVDEPREHYIFVAAWGQKYKNLSLGAKGSLATDAVVSTTIRECRVFQIEDLADTDLYRDGDPTRRTLVDDEGVRTLLGVPLIAGTEAIGSITVRRPEPKPFEPDLIALLESFAAQAVIAIENIRRFRELQTQLAREAATREILSVISQSRDDEQLVFDTILERASNICDAQQVLLALLDESSTRLPIVAHIGDADAYVAHYNAAPFTLADTAYQSVKVMLEHKPMQTLDALETPLYREGDEVRKTSVEVGQFRTFLSVPLLQGDQSIGVMVLFRREVQAFKPDQIALLESFAAQAVIAIENARQFRELQTRLEREAATREILSAISQSPADEKPVFDVILENAAKLCGSPNALLTLVDDAREYVVYAADWGEKYRGLGPGAKVPLHLDHSACLAIRRRRAVQIEDLADTEMYRNAEPHRRRLVDDEGVRTMLAVPLIADHEAIGCITLRRLEVRPFSPDQIALLETFAAQAVIAIENVRQFRAIQAANAGLSQALERQIATAEVLDVISQSQSELQPVLDKIAATAADLCKANSAGVWRLMDDTFEIAAHTSDDPTLTDLFRENPVPYTSTSVLARAVRDGEPIHIGDVQTDAELSENRRLLRSGARTFLVVPMIAPDGTPTGCINLSRHVARPFDATEIALIQTFADQATIAIENVRLFNELKTRLEREAATREILSVISQSRDDEQPVFDVILESACRLCDVPFAGLGLCNGARTHIEIVSVRGATQGYEKWLRENPIVFDENHSSEARSIMQAEPVQIADMAALRKPTAHHTRAVQVDGMRTFLAVPLISNGVGIGFIGLYKTEVSPLEEQQIELVQTFAAQAVIAIENVRQFRALVQARDAAEAALDDLRKAQERLVQSEKMASLGQLTAGIAHEIKNPLNFVNNFAKLSEDLLAELGEALQDPIKSLDEEEREDAQDLFQTVRENLKKINEHGHRADSIVKNMLLHSRTGSSESQEVALNSIASEALNLAYHGARAENPSFNVEIETNFADDVGKVECYPQDLIRVFLNLISNGMYAAFKRAQEEDGFAPLITVSSRTAGDRVEVQVSDNGGGIPESVREQIFTPFFTTKPAGEGTGLGLSLSYDILVKQHGGDLTVESEPGQTTVFTASLERTLPTDAGGNR